MTSQQQQLIVTAIEQSIMSLGSASKVATKCGLNDRYISSMRSGRPDEALKDSHWRRAAQALGVNLSGWQVVTSTSNMQDAWMWLSDAQAHKMFLAVSSVAGSGKTAACKNYRDADRARSVHYFDVGHSETNKVDFLRRLAQSLGIDTRGQGYLSANRLSDLVIEWFVARLDSRPLLIVDEACKLTDKALRFFISLYNAVEGKMGCVMLGTENLEKRIKRGVHHNVNGFDEIDSRFGRRYLRFSGVTLGEARDICAANGITDRSLQKSLFDECDPVTVVAGDGGTVKVLRDVRFLKRKVEREQLLAADAAVADVEPSGSMTDEQ